MKTNRLNFFIWSFLAAIILVALPSAIQLAPQLVGKSFIETDEFQSEMDSFYERIGPSVLNPIDVEKAKASVVVTAEEIETYRNWYGTLPEQIDNIHRQYEQRIAEAKDSGNQVLEETLIEERNRKVADIRKNFEDDEYVEQKIREMKEKVITRYVSSLKDVQFPNFQIAYLFVDVETGEQFTAGDVDVPAAYKKTFNPENDLFKAHSIHPYHGRAPTYHPGHMDTATASSSSWLGDVIGKEIETVAVDALDIDLTPYKNPVRTFKGVVIVPKTALTTGGLSEQVKGFNKRKYVAYLVWGLGILAAVMLFTVMKFRTEWVMGTSLTERYDRLKVDVKIGLLFASLFFMLELIQPNAQFFQGFNSSYYTGIWMEGIVWFAFLVLSIIGIVFQLIHLFERWKHKGALSKDIENSYAMQFLKALQDMFLNRKIGFQMFVLLIGFFLAGIGFAVVAVYPPLFLLYMPLVLFVGLPFLYVFVRRAAYLNRIMATTEAMAKGQLHEEIKIEGKSPLAKHAQNLNNLREGVRTSMTEQAKSERLKTELITNVSHDLRTPLTSIITYTDLLKKDDLSAEERAKYVGILDQKSQRLKTLIEDLFEVSKMASGNLELTKQRVDLTQLLQQALAEHAEDISASELDFRINMPETPIVALVDGQRWWRVLDNLIVNALKYAMPGTRVYVTLQQLNGRAQFVLRNISHHEIGENVDELFDRFKRADTSRHTDGSGLGLAIAQSIVDMHDGDMKIEVDGDLFKVTVVIPVIQ